MIGKSFAKLIYYNHAALSQPEGRTLRLGYSNVRGFRLADFQQLTSLIEAPNEDPHALDVLFIGGHTLTATYPPASLHMLPGHRPFLCVEKLQLVLRHGWPQPIPHTTPCWTPC